MPAAQIIILIVQALAALAPEIPEVVAAVKTAVDLLQSGTDPTAEQMAVWASRSLFTDVAVFEVHCWAQATPPDEDEDFDASQALYQTVIAQCHGSETSAEVHVGHGDSATKVRNLITSLAFFGADTKPAPHLRGLH